MGLPIRVAVMMMYTALESWLSGGMLRGGEEGGFVGGEVVAEERGVRMGEHGDQSSREVGVC